MATATLKAILERLCDDYGIGRYGTNSGTSASQLTDDTRFGGSDGAKNLDGGCALYVTGGSSGSAPDDEETRLSTKMKLATGVALLDPVLTAAFAANDTFMTVFKPLTFKTGSGPNAIIPKINQMLRGFNWEKHIRPVSLFADADMRSTGTSSYSETGDGAITKVAATFPLAARVLRMTGVTANDYIVSSTVAVEEKKSYYFEVTGMIASSGVAADQGTAILYDLTNATGLTLANATIDRFEPEILISNVTMSSGTEQVEARLEADNAGDIIDWTNLVLRKNESRIFTLPDDPQRILDIGQVKVTTESKWSRRSWNEMQTVDAEVVTTDAGIWQLHLGESVSGMAVFYEQFVVPATLSAATDTTQIPVEHLAAAVAEALLKPLRFLSKDWASKYEFAASQAAGVYDRYWSQNQTVVNQAPAAYRLARV